jgi:hypothetical protein
LDFEEESKGEAWGAPMVSEGERELLSGHT